MLLLLVCPFPFNFPSALSLISIYCSRFFSFDYCFFYNILTLKGLTLSEYFRDEEGQDGTKLSTLCSQGQVLTDALISATLH